MNDSRDSIDFGTMNIPRLFVKLFIPTLLGLVSNALLNLADGMFVGHKEETSVAAIRCWSMTTTNEAH